MDISEASRAWFVINAKVRIDSFNQDTLKALLNRSQEASFQNVALDLRTTRFISIQAIQTISQFADALRAKGGAFALIGPTERAKRHFEIYGSLRAITVMRAAEVVAAEKVAEKVDLLTPKNSTGSDQGPQL